MIRICDLPVTSDEHVTESSEAEHLFIILSVGIWTPHTKGQTCVLTVNPPPPNNNMSFMMTVCPGNAIHWHWQNCNQDFPAIFTPTLFQTNTTIFSDSAILQYLLTAVCRFKEAKRNQISSHKEIWKRNSYWLTYYSGNIIRGHNF